MAINTFARSSPYLLLPVMCSVQPLSYAQPLNKKAWIDVESPWWTDSTPVDVRRFRGEIICAVKGALDEAGLEIPFPCRTLTFKEALQTKVLDK